ncbi:MAG: hypothetical protein HFG66_07300 [Hungatella sp.]|nr:hypothetical protein [Hungatella sp.]
MITHTYITKIVTVMAALAVLVCILARIFPEKAVEALGGAGVAVRYESELFDTQEIIHIDIQMEESEWEDMLSHAAEETYYSCDVVINDQTIRHVGIRPKGNTSLSAIVADPNTDRYSLKLEFDHYVDGQTCLGLDKLILNNNYADATNMKEALVYDMYQYLDADASLYNYAEVSVNGEYWGVYLALEAVEDSFLLRNYGTKDGALYKPESMGMGGERPENGRAPGADNQKPGREPGAIGEMRPNGEAAEPPGKASQSPDEAGEFPGEAPLQVQEDSTKHPERGKMSGMPGGNFLRGGSGADLNYTDDNLDSYSTIWEGEVTDTGKSDHRRVVTALKHISEGTELERCLDIDNLLRYMAVHVFSVNMDSLSGMMAHNYYLYEQDGQLNILPWDYNLSFGGMNMGRSGNGTEMINDAIDTPFQITRFFDALLKEETYRSKYHEYLQKLVDAYVFGGGFEEFYSRVRDQIDGLVQTDPTAFYSYEEYDAGAKMLYQTVLLRAESIKGQLDGSIPSTDQGQTDDSKNLVDGSSIDIEVMGVMSGHDNDRGRDRFPGQSEEPDKVSTVPAPEAEAGSDTSGTPAAPAMEAFRENPGFPAASGMENRFTKDPGQMDPHTLLLNLAVYGGCLLAAVLALLLARRFRRKPYR